MDNRCHDKVSTRKPLCEEPCHERDVSGVARVVHPGQAVEFAAARPEVEADSGNAAALERAVCLKRVPGSGASFEPVEQQHQRTPAVTNQTLGIDRKIQIHKITVRQFDPFAPQGDPAAWPQKAGTQRLKVRPRKPPGRSKRGRCEPIGAHAENLDRLELLR